MEPERIDLSPLDPTGDQLGYERRIRQIMDRAGPELARRRGITANPFVLLADWARPTMAAAAVIAIVAFGAIVVAERNGIVVDEPVSIVEAPAADWLSEHEEPTELLVMAMEGGR